MRLNNIHWEDQLRFSTTGIQLTSCIKTIYTTESGVHLIPQHLNNPTSDTRASYAEILSD